MPKTIKHKTRSFTVKLSEREFQSLQQAREVTGRPISELLRDQLNLLVFSNLPETTAPGVEPSQL
jgi:hypothetical protein